MANMVPKYRQVADYVREGIRGGKFDPARRLPSEMELAAKFGASRPTVVRAMRELQALASGCNRAGRNNNDLTPRSHQPGDIRSEIAEKFILQSQPRTGQNTAADLDNDLFAALNYLRPDFRIPFCGLHDDNLFEIIT